MAQIPACCGSHLRKDMDHRRMLILYILKSELFLPPNVPGKAKAHLVCFLTDIIMIRLSCGEKWWKHT